MLKSFYRVMVALCCLVIIIFILLHERASRLPMACQDTCAMLYADYVIGNEYGCVCSYRELTPEEEERAARRFVTPMGGVDIE